MKHMRRGVPNLLKDGHKSYSGLEAVVLKNIDACKKLSKITRTSLGPNGMTCLPDRFLSLVYTHHNFAASWIVSIDYVTLGVIFQGKTKWSSTTSRSCS